MQEIWEYGLGWDEELPTEVIKIQSNSDPSDWHLCNGRENLADYVSRGANLETIHLQTSMYSPGFESRPYGTSIGVASHDTGWPACSPPVPLHQRTERLMRI
ncbi:hypothetical protein TNCV_544601 [Trichonephila clavipes]|nr:hypothetical protein TNCV_544601 [Trichonephila clavipes]